MTGLKKQLEIAQISDTAAIKQNECVRLKMSAIFPMTVANIPPIVILSPSVTPEARPI
ncbi:hypothetical protein [Campylobacter concisus]|uniref:hypothetical protein n=1 Tax=Campylobacter concisus TaxID=199 RepID=UPI0015E161AE|nr:hypothetical protein [Campylobacter concisus]